MIKRINISEIDTTISDVANITTDIVYIPGFAVGGEAEVRVPVLCNSLAEFERNFGSTAPEFATDQPYPDAFPDRAKNTNQDPITPGGKDYIMFAAKTSDPSYVYAKQLLTAGLSVVYEKINKINSLPNYSEFSAESTYAVGDIVEYELGYYICITEIATAGAWDDTYWRDATVEYPEYSNKSTYAVNSLVMYEGTLYKANTAIAEAEDWNAEHWTEIGVYTPVEEYDVTVERMYEAMTIKDTDEESSDEEVGIYSLKGAISQVSDYDVKYITSGGYPTFEYYETETSMLSDRLIALAQQRGDAIAFIDHTNNPYRPLAADNTNSVYYAAKTLSSNYATMITPYAQYDFGEMPGSFSYLLALARSLRTYPSWLPIAGVTRGLIPQIKKLCTSKTLTNAIADSYQTDPENSGGQASINAITLIRNQGYVIWGDRTLAQYATGAPGFASLFLHMRNLICDVRKQCYVSAQRYMFEQNTDILWINFTNSIKNLLDQMVASSVIDYYKFIKIQPSNKTKISCKITIRPVYAVEEFDIVIVMTDEEITVE